MEAVAGLFGLAFGGLWFAFVMAMGVVSLGLAVFWVWVLVDVLQHETGDNNQKLTWVLVIIFTRAIGAIIYLAVRRPERVRTLGR